MHLASRALVFALFVFAAAQAAWADTKPAPIFSDHMVLQREVQLPVWGSAAPGETVKVSLAGSSSTARTDPTGRWRVELPALKAGGPHTLTIDGADSEPVTIQDVLIGEVWLCGGQSNMEWPVRAVTNAAQEMARADHPRIRMFNVPHKASAVPLAEIAGSWSVCTPKSVTQFTACGYFMALKLQDELDVPIGLISSNWGGTLIEPWTPPSGFATEPALSHLAEIVAKRSPEHPARKAAARAYLKALEKWMEAAGPAIERGKPLPPQPTAPEELTVTAGPREPSMLWNGMLHGLAGYALRGVVWYQGESNLRDGALYADKMRALIHGWRTSWKQGDFPFYFVQLAPFRYGNNPSHLLPEIWEAQARAQRDTPNSGMVVINDIATLDNIHPPNKQDVGLRLAQMALKRTYGQRQLIDSGPLFSKLEEKSGQLRVTFTNTVGGLKWRDGQIGSFFEIAGAGTGWHVAKAKIQDDVVVLSHPDVKFPTAMRFAWHKLAQPTLVNGAGLPTGAFRAGSIPRPDALAQIEEAKEYTLALDLDLKQLSGSIPYDVDRRSEIAGAFDRIAYLMELETPAGVAQHVWVSMDAFTTELAKIGVPTAASDALFARTVTKMNVSSNVTGVVNGRALASGVLEFWPNNYGPRNRANVPGASDQVYDFGDDPGPPLNGYGSMQIHDHKSKTTLFAINHWTSAGAADLGIGNHSTGGRKATDWTFASNAGTYLSGRLRVFVRTTKK